MTNAHLLDWFATVGNVEMAVAWKMISSRMILSKQRKKGRRINVVSGLRALRRSLKNTRRRWRKCTSWKPQGTGCSTQNIKTRRKATKQRGRNFKSRLAKVVRCNKSCHQFCNRRNSWKLRCDVHVERCNRERVVKPTSLADNFQVCTDRMGLSKQQLTAHLVRPGSAGGKWQLKTRQTNPSSDFTKEFYSVSHWAWRKISSIT